jgi:hypothetical protein
MESTYTARKTIRRDGQEHFAEVTVRASPGPPPSRVSLTAEALDDLWSAFRWDYEFHRHNVWAAVMVEINGATRVWEMDQGWATAFHAEVLRVRVSGNAGLELSGALLSVAGIDAMDSYLDAWEEARVCEGGGGCGDRDVGD